MDISIKPSLNLHDDLPVPWKISHPFRLAPRLQDAAEAFVALPGRGQEERRGAVLGGQVHRGLLLGGSSGQKWETMRFFMQDGAPKIAKLPYKWLYGRYNYS